MAANDYSWVAEKKRQALAAKLARRGMPSYAQRPVSERYGTSYTGMGADGRVDRSAPAGFDASTDPPHIYHEGELRVSTPEGAVYLNADIAPAADPGAVKEYEAGARMENAELASLAPRSDAKRRFQGTRAQPNSLVDLEGSGEYPGFAAGGGMVSVGPEAPKPEPINWGPPVAGRRQLPAADNYPSAQGQPRPSPASWWPKGRVNPAAFGNSGAATLSGSGASLAPSMPAAANNYPPVQGQAPDMPVPLLAGQRMPRSFASGGAVAKAPVVGEAVAKAPVVGEAGQPAGAGANNYSPVQGQQWPSVGAAFKAINRGKSMGNAGAELLNTQGGGATEANPAPLLAGQKLPKVAANNMYNYDDTTGDQYYGDGSIYNVNSQKWRVQDPSTGNWIDYTPPSPVASVQGSQQAPPSTGSGGITGLVNNVQGGIPAADALVQEAIKAAVDKGIVGEDAGKDKMFQQDVRNSAMGLGSIDEFRNSDYYNSLNDLEKLGAEAEWNNYHPKEEPPAAEASPDAVQPNSAQKYIDMANTPYDGNMFMQNPYTQKQIDDMRMQGASRQAYLAHQQAMLGTDANAAWAQRLMQAAQTEEGLNDFAAKAHAADWEQMRSLADKWLESDDPAAVAQAARIYGYMMPGLDAGWADGRINKAVLGKIGEARTWALSQIEENPTLTEDQVVDLLRASYGDTLDPATYAIIARNATVTTYDKMWDEFTKTNSQYIEADDDTKKKMKTWFDELYWGEKIDDDDYIGNPNSIANINKDESIEASGGDGYNSGVSDVLGVDALELAKSTDTSDATKTKQIQLKRDIVAAVEKGTLKVGTLVDIDPQMREFIVSALDSSSLIINGAGNMSHKEDGNTGIRIYKKLDEAKNDNKLVRIGDAVYMVDKNTTLQKVKTMASDGTSLSTYTYRTYTLKNISTGETITWPSENYNDFNFAKGTKIVW